MGGAAARSCLKALGGEVGDGGPRWFLLWRAGSSPPEGGASLSDLKASCPPNWGCDGALKCGIFLR